MDDPMEGEEFASKSEAFITWLHQSGTTISPKIQLADLRSRDAGRGVLATKDIADDEELFTIPRSSVLTAESSALPKDINFDDQWLALITAMVYEYQRGDDSPWKPYFDVLPDNFITLMFWSGSELEHLEGSAVVNKIGKKSADEAFKTKVIPVLQQHADIFKLQDASEDQLSRLCHRMGSTIMAYAFDLEKPGSSDSTNEEEDWEEDREETEITPKGMVPLADMLNADADRNNAKLYYEDDKVVMKSIKAIKAGEEILNDYGSLPSADMLRRYGYTTSNYEKYDVVEISLDLIKQAATETQKMQTKQLIERTAYLAEQGILEEGYDIAHPSNPENQQLPDELCILLNTLILSKSDFDKLKKKDKLPKTILCAESSQLLYTILVKRRAMYKFDSFDDNMESLQRTTTSNVFSSVANPAGNHDAVSPSHRHLQAHHIVEGEKKVLQEAADAVQGMTASTDGASRKRKAPTATFEEEARSVRASQGKPMNEEQALKNSLGLGNSQQGRRTGLEHQGKKTKYSGA
ncbi:hypothetical protein LTR36_005917 [Oleoguttula mirabilis]|uniref:SET domain-containing protein n=1 Tax=Oleoguttula mirabilis TaxID=1507867 RepID=A0AAV9JF74_9PEZI|nr:hypothetical protein LTR36_005917 [Oleoguttula mirabilis]